MENEVIDIAHLTRNQLADAYVYAVEEIRGYKRLAERYEEIIDKKLPELEEQYKKNIAEHVAQSNIDLEKRRELERELAEERLLTRALLDKLLEAASYEAHSIIFDVLDEEGNLKITD